MNRKRLLGLILFACFVTAVLFFSADYLTKQVDRAKAGQEQSYTKDGNSENTKSVDTSDKSSVSDAAVTATNISPGAAVSDLSSGDVKDITASEPWLAANPSDTGSETALGQDGATASPTSIPGGDMQASTGTFTTSFEAYESPKLIYDSNSIDYKSYIPDMVYDSTLETALNISNPNISVAAKAAILLDADTQKVLFYKNPVQAMFPASTAKLLTSLVALQWCKVDEQVTIGDEISMIASDSTRAYLVEGQVLTIQNLLEGMLLPSGNDAAYAVAAYVGRKSLGNAKAVKEEAVAEFVRLMNEKAVSLGVKNSCFKTPDGYDAVGQYTTAYDMGLIGAAAANNSTITEISQKSSSRNNFVSGEDVTWSNTNKLITRYSGQYYSHAIGLKTGTSSMAGRCVIAAAEYNGKKVVCVIMDSTQEGRWEDAITLLKYGLD
ncbi:MAG TPA: serine hydrolase [Mobilitalea sp.]|nr:serine hydrolase [Mobilitalea sp.]